MAQGSYLILTIKDLRPMSISFEFSKFFRGLVGEMGCKQDISQILFI